jgi:biopolymer transport protein ExbB
MIKLFMDPVIDAIALVNSSGEKTQNNDLIYTSVYEGISDFELELQKGLTFLATVGSTAPFVGLFGTVWAIYHALIAIGLAGEASLDKVAGPVGEALVMTAIGLAVAVPAVLAYNWLLRRNKTIMRTLNAVGNRIIST